MHGYIRPFDIYKKRSQITAVEVYDGHNSYGYMGVAFSDGTWTAVEFRRDEGFRDIGGITHGFSSSARAMVHIVARLGLITRSEASAFGDQLWKADQQAVQLNEIRCARSKLEALGYKVTK